MRSSACASSAFQSRGSKCRRPPACGDRFSEVACDLLARGQAIRFSAPGWSMQPTILNGETVLVEPVEASQVRRGDTVLYRWERGVRAHRVVRTVAQASACDAAAPVFTLRGDAGGNDERVRAEEVFGRVVSLERQGQWIRLRGPVAFARRAFRQGASRVKRFVTNRWRLLSRGRFPEEQAILSVGVPLDEREQAGSLSVAGEDEFAAQEQMRVR